MIPDPDDLKEDRMGKPAGLARSVLNRSSLAFTSTGRHMKSLARRISRLTELTAFKNSVVYAPMNVANFTGSILQRYPAIADKYAVGTTKMETSTQDELILSPPGQFSPTSWPGEEKPAQTLLPMPVFPAPPESLPPSITPSEPEIAPRQTILGEGTAPRKPGVRAISRIEEISSRATSPAGPAVVSRPPSVQRSEDRAQPATKEQAAPEPTALSHSETTAIDRKPEQTPQVEPAITTFEPGELTIPEELSSRAETSASTPKPQEPGQPVRRSTEATPSDVLRPTQPGARPGIKPPAPAVSRQAAPSVPVPASKKPSQPAPSSEEEEVPYQPIYRSTFQPPMGSRLVEITPQAAPETPGSEDFGGAQEKPVKPGPPAEKPTGDKLQRSPQAVESPPSVGAQTPTVVDIGTAEEPDFPDEPEYPTREKPSPAASQPGQEEPGFDQLTGAEEKPAPVSAPPRSDLILNRLQAPGVSETVKKPGEPATPAPPEPETTGSFPEGIPADIQTKPSKEGPTSSSLPSKGVQQPQLAGKAGSISEMPAEVQHPAERESIRPPETSQPDVIPASQPEETRPQVGQPELVLARKAQPVLPEKPGQVESDRSAPERPPEVDSTASSASKDQISRKVASTEAEAAKPGPHAVPSAEIPQQVSAEQKLSGKSIPSEPEKPQQVPEASPATDLSDLDVTAPRQESPPKISLSEEQPDQVVARKEFPAQPEEQVVSSTPAEIPTPTPEPGIQAGPVEETGGSARRAKPEQAAKPIQAAEPGVPEKPTIPSAERIQPARTARIPPVEPSAPAGEDVQPPVLHQLGLVLARKADEGLPPSIDEATTQRYPEAPTVETPEIDRRAAPPEEQTMESGEAAGLPEVQRALEEHITGEQTKHLEAAGQRKASLVEEPRISRQPESPLAPQAAQAEVPAAPAEEQEKTAPEKEAQLPEVPTQAMSGIETVEPGVTQDQMLQKSMAPEMPEKPGQKPAALQPQDTLLAGKLEPSHLGERLAAAEQPGTPSGMGELTSRKMTVNNLQRKLTGFEPVKPAYQILPPEPAGVLPQVRRQADLGEPARKAPPVEMPFIGPAQSTARQYAQGSGATPGLHKLPLARQPQVVQTVQTHPPTTTAQPQMPLAPVVSTIQRTPEPTSTAMIQRVETIEPEVEEEEVNLDELARQVYPLIKRMLAIERERWTAH